MKYEPQIAWLWKHIVYGLRTFGLIVMLALAACAEATDTLPTLVPTVEVRFVAPEEPTIMVAPSATPVPQSYPAQLLPTPAPQAYPGLGVIFPPPTPTEVIDWFVPVTEVTGYSESLLPDFQPTPTAPMPQVNCDFENSKLIWRLSESALSGIALSFFAAEGATCPSQIDIAPDGSAAVLVYHPHHAYLWLADGSAPIAIGDICVSEFSSVWSPDAQRLAFLRPVCDMGLASTAQANIVDKSGALQVEFLIEGGSDGQTIDWLTNEIVCRGDRMSVPCHFVGNGKRVFSLQGWKSPIGGGKAQQHPSISPNQRWILLDEGRYVWSNNGGVDRIQQSYVVFDVQRLTRYQLPSTGENPLAFAGWSLDSSTAFLISRPLRANSLPAPEMPFGLFAFEVETRRSTMLFEQAVHVWWSPNQQYAAVVFPTRKANDALGLDVGVWQVGAETLVGRAPLSDELIYIDPGWDFYRYGNSSFGSFSWSPNGQKLVVGTLQGELYLFDIDGKVQILARKSSRLMFVPAQYTWSLDTTQLLVHSGARAWVVKVP